MEEGRVCAARTRVELEARCRLLREGKLKVSITILSSVAQDQVLEVARQVEETARQGEETARQDVQQYEEEDQSKILLSRYCIISILQCRGQLGKFVVCDKLCLHRP